MILTRIISVRIIPLVASVPYARLLRAMRGPHSELTNNCIVQLFLGYTPTTLLDVVSLKFALVKRACTFYITRE